MAQATTSPTLVTKAHGFGTWRVGTMESCKYKTGVTLIEILVAVAVIVILAGIAVGIAEHVGTQSKEKAVKATFALLESALQEYYDFAGKFPDANHADPRVNSEKLYSELYALPDSRKVLEQISNKVFQNKFNPGAVPAVQEIYDPWGMVVDYIYNPGESFPELISSGPDKDMATVGDNITNR